MQHKNSKLNILILTHNQNRHFYLINEIISSKLGNVFTITNGKKINNISLKKKFLNIFSVNNFYKILFYNYYRKVLQEKEQFEKSFFSNQKKKFFNSHSKNLIGEVNKKNSSINDQYFIDLIKKINPDITIVMGTCLLSKSMINNNNFIINMHTGLSPYYRGSHTNFWPFILDELNMFGVTIHKLDNGIDSGDIIYSQNIKWKKGLNFSTLNCMSIIEGVNLIKKTIINFKINNVKAVKQAEKGNLFYNKDFNALQCKQYYKKLEYLDKVTIDVNKLKHKFNIVQNGVICKKIETNVE